MDAKQLIEQTLDGALPSDVVSSILQEKINDASAMAKAIETAIKKHFPKSTVNVSPKRALGKPSIYLFFAVAGSRSEVNNGIWENDLSLTKAYINGVNDDGTLHPRMMFDPFMGGGIHTNPPYVKVGLRKKTGTPEQIVKHIDSYFAKLLSALKSNADKIPDSNKSLLKSIKL